MTTETVDLRAAAPLYSEVAQLWTELLNPATPIEPHTDFFELGGDSLAIMVMLFQVEERFGVAIPQWQLSKNPTLKGFCELLASAPS